jgi:hypothetical protein
MINSVGKEAKKTGIRLFSDSGARGSEVHCSHSSIGYFWGVRGKRMRESRSAALMNWGRIITFNVSLGEGD